MNMRTSSSKIKMRGFMCHSPGAIAVCKANDPRSVIVPRRPNRLLIEHAKLINNNAKYARLSDSTHQRFASANKRKVAINLPSIKKDRDLAYELKPSPATQTDQIFQVVVMKVAIHCQGCAGKVKKHLSKMEGVTSFSIDLETRRVTVMGHVSPVVVLESISKVKKAEFWTC